MDPKCLDTLLTHALRQNNNLGHIELGTLVVRYKNLTGGLCVIVKCTLYIKYVKMRRTSVEDFIVTVIVEEFELQLEGVDIGGHLGLAV